jgi:flagellar hook protein FlgE
MNAVTSVSLSGLNAATTRLDAAANNIANSQTPGFKRDMVVQQTQEKAGVLTVVGKAQEVGPELAADLVEQMQATYAFRANLRTIQTQNNMTGSLLDLQA